jgi:hypothetical protein
MSTPAVILAVGIAMIFFVALANLVLYQYAAGAVRAALDQGVRAESYAGAAPGTCEASIEETLDALLGGSYGDGVIASCFVDPTGPTVVATASALFPSIALWVPDYTFVASARAVKEVAP